MPEDYDHDHDAVNDPEHVLHHCKEICEELVNERAIPLIVIYQKEDESNGMISCLDTAEVLQNLRRWVEFLERDLSDEEQWRLPS